MGTCEHGLFVLVCVIAPPRHAWQARRSFLHITAGLVAGPHHHAIYFRAHANLRRGRPNVVYGSTKNL